MSDWEIDLSATPHTQDATAAALEARLESTGERLGLVQQLMRLCADDLAVLVREAVDAGMPLAKVASLSRIALDDVQRILDTGALY